MDLLLLCTGNICRSPMAEAFLKDRLAARGVEAKVHSAGVIAGGRPASDFGVAVVRSRGLDISAHRSRTVEEELLHDADLVLGMARVHVREAVVMVPEVWPRAFTLKELVRRGSEVGRRTEGQPFDEWLEKCHAGRSHADLLGDAPADDVIDPMGRTREVYERVAAELYVLVERLVDLSFPSPPSPPSPTTAPAPEEPQP